MKLDDALYEQLLAAIESAVSHTPAEWPVDDETSEAFMRRLVRDARQLHRLLAATSHLSQSVDQMMDLVELLLPIALLGEVPSARAALSERATALLQDAAAAAQRYLTAVAAATTHDSPGPNKDLN